MAGLTMEQLRDIYERYAPTLFRRARAIVGRDADAWDVVHEVFRVMSEASTEFRGEANPLTYMYRVTTNMALNVLRARARCEPNGIELDALEQRSLSPGAVEARSLLAALMQELDERSLQIATLHFLDGLTQEEIAAIVKLSRKTVGKKLSDIKARAARLAGLRHGVAHG